MITPFLLSVALATLPAFGGEPGVRLAPATLYTEFRQEPPAAVVAALQNEVKSIMAPIGLNFEWRSLASSDGRQISVELAVVRFKGRCDVDGLSRHDTYPGALGWTHMSEGIILPFADIDCDAVRSFIQRELMSRGPEERAESFGRALGRVLAHELYHIFANTTHHGSEGVGRSVYSAQNLLAPDFQFEPRECEALRNSKAHDMLTLAGR